MTVLKLGDYSVTKDVFSSIQTRNSANAFLKHNESKADSVHLVQKFFSMESFVLTALPETLHTFERFQRQCSKDHNSNVKVGFFIFL